MIKRTFDVLLSLLLFIVLVIPMTFISLAVIMTSPGPIFFWSPRVGRLNKVFQMPKFRTMLVGSPVVATHLLENPRSHLTPIGAFLRKTSLDELPQLWSVLRGQMSFVGPRPALFNQIDLIELRRKAGVDQVLPGLTGWAQVNGRDDLSIPEKVRFDTEYVQKRSFGFDMKILFMTLVKVMRSKGVSH